MPAGGNWLNFDATVAEVEALLQTEYKYYEHESGKGHIACDEYSVPQHLQGHIDLVMPTVHFDIKTVPEPEYARKKRDLPGAPWNIGSLPKQGKILAAPGMSPEVSMTGSAFTLANCNTYITPDCLRALYNFPNGTLGISSYGIVEYTPEAYVPSDLNLFYSNLAREIPAGTVPTLDSIDGGVNQQTTKSFNDNGESDLDLQYAIALGTS